MATVSDPILSCAEAADFERRLFGEDEAAAWAAMRRAGLGIAEAVLRDIQEIGGLPGRARILVLAGKGHNGGDALIAAGALLERFPGATADVVFAFGERALRPLAQRAWRELSDAFADRVRVVLPGPAGEAASLRGPAYDLSLDGVFGYQFRPPVDPRAGAVLGWANRLPVRLRAAVDLPSGPDEPDGFRADFTYATGIVKTPLLGCANAGRPRYVDLGFFSDCGPELGRAAERVLKPSVLGPLCALRRPQTDKRDYGHLLVVGGSRGYPGAVLMSVLAALRSGAGLVTAFVPESLAAAYAARAPEAMWVGWPETPGGGLALEGLSQFRSRLGRATAVVMGPGLGGEPETLALAGEIAGLCPVPLVLDADALQEGVVRAGSAPRILTPHAGEFARISGGADLRRFCAGTGWTVILKGPVTRIASGAGPVYHSFFGGPVLARGGSGDILAGLAGGLLAQSPSEPMLAACRAAAWHGLSADLLARARGQTAVSVTQLLDFLPQALRHGED